MNTHPNPDTPTFSGLPGARAVVFGLLALLLPAVWRALRWGQAAGTLQHSTHARQRETAAGPSRLRYGR